MSITPPKTSLLLSAASPQPHGSLTSSSLSFQSPRHQIFFLSHKSQTSSISPELKVLPQKQQHRHLAQARTPRLLHPTSTCPSTFQHLCNIPHLSTQIPSPRLAHHCWPIWWHASNTLWMASPFLLPHPKSISGQSAPIYLQEQLQHRYTPSVHLD